MQDLPSSSDLPNKDDNDKPLNQDNNIEQRVIINNLDKQTVIAKLQTKLKITWLLWLWYRSIFFAILLNVFLATHPNIVGGIAWQVMLLIPALILTPWMLKGKSPYALLVGSMITLVYLGASGVTLFAVFYGSGIHVWWVYALDAALLFMINIWMFKLLKVLPSMNNVEKKSKR